MVLVRSQSSRGRKHAPPPPAMKNTLTRQPKYLDFDFLFRTNPGSVPETRSCPSPQVPACLSFFFTSTAPRTDITMNTSSLLPTSPSFRSSRPFQENLLFLQLSFPCSVSLLLLGLPPRRTPAKGVLPLQSITKRLAGGVTGRYPLFSHSKSQPPGPSTSLR